MLREREKKKKSSVGIIAKHQHTSGTREKGIVDDSGV